jgi:hypothetical protein
MLFKYIGYVTSNIRMIMSDELDTAWKEVAVVYFRVMSQHLPGVIEENHDKQQ